MRPHLFLLLAATLLWGCGTDHSSEGHAGAGPQYLISGNVPAAGRHDLHPGDTVSVVLDRDLADANVGAITLVLVRQGPEGKSRQLIQLNASGKLMDEKQNYVLRDGDELIFPSGASSPESSSNRPDLPPARGGP